MKEEIRRLFPKEMKYVDALPIANYIENLQSQLKAKEEENEQLKADYGNLAQIERDFLKEVIKEIKKFIEEHLTDNGRFLMLNEWQVPYLLEILSKGENK